MSGSITLFMVSTTTAEYLIDKVTTSVLVCEPNVVQLSGTPFGDVIYKFWGEIDLHGTSMGPNPEGFGSNLSRNISPNATKFFTHMYLHVF